MTAYPKFQADDTAHSGDLSRARAPQQRHLIALTNDPALNRALQELAAGDVAVSIVTDLRTLTDELMQHTSATALIDAAALDAPVDGTVDAITTQFPELRLLIAGQGAEQHMLATRIANQSVFRFVHKPASPQRLRLFLDAAARPLDTRSAAATTQPMQPGKEPLARIETAMRGKSPQTLAIIGVVAIAAIAAGAWAFWPDNESATAPPGVATTPVVPASPQATALIKQADQAFASGKYVGSDGSSAAELYREALKLDSTNTIARSGFDRSVEYALRGAEEALLAARLNDASAIAEQLRLVAPNNSRLSFLNTQISREQARVNADASLRQASEARQSQVRAALAEMNERMRRGALIDPATNSAVSHFREAEAVGAGDPAVRSAREALIGALLTAADNELTARRPPAARRLVDAAGSINSSAPGLDVLRRRVDEVSAQLVAASAEAAAQTARAAEAAQQVAAPEPVAAAAAADASSRVVVASSLRLLRKEEPVYPARALDQLVSGWVEMEFTVTKDGSVENVVVTDASPRRTFDAAAITALSRYRYAPVIRDGEAVAQRARMRMRFTAKEIQ